MGQLPWQSVPSSQKVILHDPFSCLASQGNCHSLHGARLPSIAFRGFGNVIAPCPKAPLAIALKTVQRRAAMVALAGSLGRQALRQALEKARLAGDQCCKFTR